MKLLAKPSLFIEVINIETTSVPAATLAATGAAHKHRRQACDIGALCWPQVQDLRVIDILPQMVALSESYFQVTNILVNISLLAAGLYYIILY